MWEKKKNVGKKFAWGGKKLEQSSGPGPHKLLFDPPQVPSCDPVHSKSAMWGHLL
jgi:hypothetical protein